MSQPNIISSGSTGTPLQDFIEMYKRYLSQHFEEVKDGEDMLQLGAKTSIIQELEKFLASPIDALVMTHTTTTEALRKFVEQFMVIFFKTAKENNLISNVFKLRSDRNVLSYGISLTEDTFEKRESVLDLLNLYHNFNFAEKVPVYFQFVPENLVSAFGNVTNAIEP